jgi:hypothetical protein
MNGAFHRVRSFSGVLVAGALAVLAFAADAPALEICAPRPGQPSPLPRLDDADPLRARWSALRVRELADRAGALEASDPLGAHAFWIRAACLAPGSVRVSKGVTRTAPVRVYRPWAVVGTTPLPAREDPWASLSEPVVVVRSGGSFVALEQRNRARAVLLSEIDGWTSQVDEGVRRARFEDALEVADRVRATLDAMREDSDLPPRWARLEVLQATAELALGRSVAARASLVRALAAEPALELDPATTSPKVLQSFESIRSRRGNAP